MKNFLKRTFISLLVFSFSLPAFAEVSVIVHPSNASSISNDDIKRIFLGKMKSFPGGSQVLPVNQSSASATRKAFDSGALGKSASQIKAYWSKLVFSGKGNPPKEVPNDQDVINLVKDNPAVIGYIDSASVSGDVKVVAKF
ncbi:MAG: hypothetical protein OQK04_07505 [Kangiellaceae bacterium]|nr:hypothetical protein [Kangiellaceae bacterium]MCW8998545.1 hypothetical protein [Kangiellaceae bacterium]